MSDALEVELAVCSECDHNKPGTFEGVPCFGDAACFGRYERKTFVLKEEIGTSVVPDATLFTQRWLDSDPLLPGVTHVVTFSLGGLLAMISPRMAVGALLAYIFVAIGVHIGAELSGDGDA